MHEEQSTMETSVDSKEKSLILVRLARSRRATDLVVLDLRNLVTYTDYFVICTGRSDRQVRAIAEHLEAELRGKKIRPRSVEGMTTGRWVLMDFDDVVVHIFQREVREFYDLEGLWADAPRVSLPPDPEETVESAESLDEWEEDEEW
jgi:ribosome-associated protein